MRMLSYFLTGIIRKGDQFNATIWLVHELQSSQLILKSNHANIVETMTHKMNVLQLTQLRHRANVIIGMSNS
jgi:hypothetical protein